MSGRILRRTALRLVEELLVAPARDDVTRAIQAVNEQFPSFIYEVGRDAGLAGEELYRRGAALVLQYASVQLADDLADGDCGYLAPASRVGPAAQWLLSHLFTLMLGHTEIPASSVLEASRDFVTVGQGQQVEIRTTTWDLASATRAAECLNGAQYRAYLRLLSAGTASAAWAEAHAFDFGVALHVVGDRVHGDQRWSGLSTDEQQALSQLGLAAAERAAGSRIDAVEAQLHWFRHVLQS